MSSHGIHTQYVPKTAFAKWLESRLPIIGLGVVTFFIVEVEKAISVRIHRRQDRHE